MGVKGMSELRGVCIIAMVAVCAVMGVAIVASNDSSNAHMLFPLAVLALFTMLVASNDSSNAYMAQKNSFLNNEHACPTCGWEGRPRLMRQTGGPYGVFKVTYYCPQCGTVLGVY